MSEQNTEKAQRTPEQQAEKTWKDSLIAGLAHVAKDIGNEIVHKVEQGAHEMASLLYRGDAFVMYGNREVNKEDQSLKDALQQEPVKKEELQEKRGGMSL